MRIGIDVRALMEGRTTGVQVYIQSLLRALFAIDKANQYVLFANSFRNVNLRKFDKPNVEVRLTRYPNKLFNFLQRFFSWPSVERLIGPVDIFFSPHWRTLAVKKSTPLIVTFHDLSFETVPEFYTVWKRIWHWLMGYRQVAVRADSIIAVSENTKKDLVEIYGVEKDRIAVIHSGIKPLSGSPLARGESNKEYFLCFGTLEPRKNIEAVLAAYEEYAKQSADPKKLIIAGSSGWKSNLPGGIEVRQNVSEEEKAKLYSGAFALLFLSFYEGFGFPVLEAASAGVPVIASFATSSAEIGHEFALLVNPFRPGQVASAMLELESKPEYYEHLKSAGLEAVKKFNWNDTACKVLELFSQYENRN